MFGPDIDITTEMVYDAGIGFSMDGRTDDVEEFLDIRTERWLWGVAMTFCILKNIYS